jgi:hypothetical protein
MIRLGCDDQVLPINAATHAARTASKNAVKLLMMFKARQRQDGRRPCRPYDGGLSRSAKRLIRIHGIASRQKTIPRTM